MEHLLRLYPSDRHIRLVVADWLDERDQGERAELLRLEPINMTLECLLQWINVGEVVYVGTDQVVGQSQRHKIQAPSYNQWTDMDTSNPMAGIGRRVQRQTQVRGWGSIR